MIVKSENAKKIDLYLRNNPCFRIGNWPIELSGEKKIVPYYKFPLDLLFYNIKNGRFSIEKIEREKQIHRELDPLDQEDAKIIRDLLLNIFPEKTQTLKEDIRKKGQMEPGVITFDGFVINGNRRMAILQELHKEEPTGKWAYLEAVRLEPNINRKDVWKLEVGLQLSKEKKADYSPVNELLKIREGEKAGLTPEEIAAAMYDWSGEEVKKSLERLVLIDTFLSFIKQPDNYELIQKTGLHEYFIDVQDHILKKANQRGEKKNEILRQTEGAFRLIEAAFKKDGAKKTQVTHWDMRKLGKIYAAYSPKETYFEELAKKKKPSAEDIVEAYKTAEETYEMIEKKNEPMKLLSTAINALKNIDTKSEHFHKEEVREKLSELSDEVTKLLNKLG
jgi:hypothetical protein